MTLDPTSTLARALALAPYWLMCGAAAATWLHHRRGWPGLRWMASCWLLGLIAWGLVALELATTRPGPRR
jgi:hypothetical protein